MVHHKSRIKVQNNKEMKNMHDPLNLKLFCTYSKKRNLRSGEGEKRLLGTIIFTSKFHNAVILNWLRWFLLWSCGFRGKMWICWFRSDCEPLQQALDNMDLFGANLMFVLNLPSFWQRVGLLFTSKGNGLTKWDWVLFPNQFRPLRSCPKC